LREGRFRRDRTNVLKVRQWPRQDLNPNPRDHELATEIILTLLGLRLSASYAPS
jgi:hypothetical protein